MIDCELLNNILLIATMMLQSVNQDVITVLSKYIPAAGGLQVLLDKGCRLLYADRDSVAKGHILTPYLSKIASHYV